MIIKLQPVLFDKVWGGDSLHRLYGYQSGQNCGEAWGISAHPVGSSIVINGPYKGKTLATLFEEERHLFGHYHGKEFPILVKLISAADDLSVQVHPNDDVARHYNSLGKEECWYILDAVQDASIQIGHRALSIAQIDDALHSNTLMELLHIHPIKTGDFFHIPPGTVHAIRRGTTLLEVQQSSNLTFRLYDYNRLHNGQLRELHIEEALSCIRIPDQKLITTPSSKYFQFELIRQTDDTKYTSSTHGDYIFIIEGHGTINLTPVKAGEFLMIPSASTYFVTGNITFQRTTF